MNPVGIPAAQTTTKHMRGSDLVVRGGRRLGGVWSVLAPSLATLVLNDEVPPLAAQRAAAALRD